MAHITKVVRISQIQMDRYPLNPRTLALVDHLRIEGNTVPPVHVQKNGNGQFKILDGRHRVTAHKLLGRTHILVRYGVDNRLE